LRAVSYDLVISNGRLLTGTIDLVADVAVEGERIAAIGSGLRGKQELDAAGMYVLPGAVDGHVHMRTERKVDVYDDTFRTGSIAAAFGGVTTIVDQAQPEPGTTLNEGLDSRLADADGECLIDYSIHVNLREASLDRVAEMASIAARGFPSFKFFTYYDTYALPDGILFAALQQIAAADGLAVVHAESKGAIDELMRQNREAGRTGPMDYVRAHSAVLEGESVHRVLTLAHAAGARCLIFHVSAADAVREIRLAKERGQRAFGEAMTHGLLFDESRMDHPTEAVTVTPPLRTVEHREALWDGLLDGTIDVVSTDHIARKRQPDASGTLVVPNGVSGVEVRLALMHTFGVGAGRLSLKRWVDACCVRPAKVFGLRGKGDLLPGYDADIVLFDPEREVTLSAEMLHSAIDHTPYEGTVLRGYPVTTVSRGEVVVADGELQAEPGRGRLVARGF
jgi:dihydropyrimidinase